MGAAFLHMDPAQIIMNAAVQVAECNKAIFKAAVDAIAAIVANRRAANVAPAAQQENAEAEADPQDSNPSQQQT